MFHQYHQSKGILLQPPIQFGNLTSHYARTQPYFTNISRCPCLSQTSVFHNILLHPSGIAYHQISNNTHALLGFIEPPECRNVWIEIAIKCRYSSYDFVCKKSWSDLWGRLPSVYCQWWFFHCEIEVVHRYDRFALILCVEIKHPKDLYNLCASRHESRHACYARWKLKIVLSSWCYNAFQYDGRWC